MTRSNVNGNNHEETGTNGTRGKKRRLATCAGRIPIATVLLLVSAAAAWAQPNSVLPPPEPPFKGKIGRTYTDLAGVRRRDDRLDDLRRLRIVGEHLDLHLG